MAANLSLHVRRHDVICRVASSSRSPAGSHLADLARRVVEEHLPARINALDANGVDGTNRVSGLWVIRRLDVHVVVAAEAGVAEAARSMAGEIVAGLDRVASEGPDGDNVMWYPDVAALLQRYLVDLVEGLADSRWEYAALGHEPSTGLAASVVHQFRERPGESVVALRRMTARGPKVINALDDAACLAALEALARAGEPGFGDPFGTLVAAAAELRRDSQLVGSESAVALRLFVGAVRSADTGATTTTAARAIEAARALVAVQGLPSSTVGEIAGAVADSRWRSIDRSLVGRIATLATWPSKTAGALIAAAAPTPDSSPAREPAGDGFPLRTNLGGLFLLLPWAAEIGLIRAAREWPPCKGVDAARVATFLVTTSALGLQRSDVACVDPVLRLATGVPSRLDADAISAWGDERIGSRGSASNAGTPSRDSGSAIETGLGPPLAVSSATNAAFAGAGREMLSALAARLPGLSASSPGYLWRNILDFTADVEIGPQRNVVRIGRPPLHLLLAITGLDRQQLRLPDEEGIEWVLIVAD